MPLRDRIASQGVSQSLCWTIVFTKDAKNILLKGEGIQSCPPKALDRRLQEDWTRDPGEGPRVLMSLGIDFGLMG